MVLAMDKAPAQILLAVLLGLSSMSGSTGNPGLGVVRKGPSSMVLVFSWMVLITFACKQANGNFSTRFLTSSVNSMTIPALQSS